MKHIALYSGGKDSTAVLILIKKHGLPLDEILYADVGKWMWPGIDKHMKKVEEYMQMPVIHLDISEQIQKGFKKWGFASPLTRWCTGIKRDEMNRYLKQYVKEGLTQYVGIAFDEQHRTGNKRYQKGEIRYPLIEYNITEAMALEMCYKEGFDFGGVYEHRSRYNCWCCPLQTLDELRILFKYYPGLWKKMREMQWISHNDFRKDETIMSLEHRWWMEQHSNKKKLWKNLIKSESGEECIGACHLCVHRHNTQDKLEV
jgi:3'-phosphoadenosine 5'-phosphosulfate sulfotransferase (PAPS reductase)/FAD synthetase